MHFGARRHRCMWSAYPSTKRRTRWTNGYANHELEDSLSLKCKSGHQPRDVVVRVGMSRGASEILMCWKPIGTLVNACGYAEKSFDNPSRGPGTVCLAWRTSLYGIKAVFEENEECEDDFIWILCWSVDAACSSVTLSQSACSLKAIKVRDPIRNRPRHRSPTSFSACT